MGAERPGALDVAAYGPQPFPSPRLQHLKAPLPPPCLGKAASALSGLDLTWETREAANLRSAPSSPRGLQPGWYFLLPRLPSTVWGGGGAEGPHSAWTSTSACPPVPRLGEEQLVWIKKWNAVLAGSPAPQAQAFWIS
ncbi:unnamed protein product [Pipistrellus nathusii]|uniref:Uncharacterized protein n=1 Tax=Pipistrellus nathusii TaxID=59473 RepID=A0ABP0AGC1_PIPNA